MISARRDTLRGLRLIASLALLITVGPSRVNGATYLATDYAYPLRQGVQWQYDVAGFGSVIREISGTASPIPGRTAVGLVTRVGNTVATTYWMSSDSGFELHRADYPGDGASIVLGSPLPYLPATFELGQSYSASAPAAIVPLGGSAASFADSSRVDTTIEATERITVPAGTFDTLRIRVVEDLSTVQLWWLARGIGIVQLSSSVDGDWVLTSTTATAVVPAGPNITRHPLSVTVTNGGTAVFSIEATADGPLTYQWRKGDTDLAGRTQPVLTLEAVTAADAGTYQVRVSRGTESILSQPATLTVTAPPAPAIAPRFISARLTPNTTQVQLLFSGTAGKSYQVESSPDLRTWTALRNVAAAAGETALLLEHETTAGPRFFRLREAVNSDGGLLTMPVPGQLYPEGTRIGGSLFGFEFTIPSEWKGGLRANSPHLLFGSDVHAGAILGMIGFAGTRASLQADPSLQQGFESDAGTGGTVHFRPSAPLGEVAPDQMRVEFTGQDPSGQGVWMGVQFVVHPDGGFLLFVGVTTTEKAGALRSQVERFAATAKVPRRSTQTQLVGALHGRSFQWAGDGSDWHNGNLNGSASLSSWSEKFAFFCADGTIEINTKSTSYASTRQSGGWSSTYMSLSFDNSTTEYGQFTIVSDAQFGDVLLLATLQGYQVAPVRLQPDGQLLVGDQRLSPNGTFRCPPQ